MVNEPLPIVVVDYTVSLLAHLRVGVSAETIWMVTRNPKPFGDFIQQTRQEKSLSCKDVEKRSARFGKRIAGSYVNRIENDPTLKPTAVALKALAYGLGVPPQEVLLRAIGLFEPGVNSEEVQLLSRFRELSPEKRGLVLDIVDMLYSKELTRRTSKRKSA
jgi:transcriptional regulator with XRE-family HTH domain